MQVLVVDPAPATREDVVNLLRDDRHDVLEAQSVEEALDALRSTRVELVICDEYLPGARGIGFCRTVLRRAIPSIAVADTAVTLAGALFASGAVDRLSKPVERRRLRGALQRACVAPVTDRDRQRRLGIELVSEPAVG